MPGCSAEASPKMCFDEVSAVYAKFGQFFIGVRLPMEKLGGWLEGKL